MANTNSTDNLFEGVLKKAAAAETEAPAKQEAPKSEAAAGADEAPATQEAPETNDEKTDAAPSMSELDMLKNRARLMGIQFSNNIGLDALKARIQAKLEGEKQPEPQPEPETEAVQETAAGTSAPKSLRQQILEREMKLVRLRITNLNPSKKDLPGEIFTVANKYLGTVRKFVPYGEATDNGYHIPYCIYKQLKRREFQNIKVRKDSRGRERVETSLAREFALEVLPQLTEGELAQLAASQAAAKGME